MVDSDRTGPHPWLGPVLEQFTIDRRALVAFRVALGLMILVDLFNRSRFLTVHYTDAGIFPRSALAAGQDEFVYSFHLLSGERWAMALLFLINAFFALALIVGFRTRLVTFVLWLFMVSLHARAPDLLQSGDIVLRLFLLWGIFLPLGAGWSIDRAMDTSETPPPRTFYSWATFGVMVQILAVYLFAAMLKYHPAWLTDGRAVQYALMLEQLTRPWVVFLLPYETLLRFATWGTMLLEFYGPILLLFGIGGVRVRMGLVLAFFALHLSFVFLMALGQFPFVSLIGWILFIPSFGFDFLARFFRKDRGSGVVIWYDRDCGFCKKVVHLLRTFLLLDDAVIALAQDDDAAGTVLRTRNSWAVRTTDGRLLDRFEALTYLARISPLLGPLIPKRLPGSVGLLGDYAYRWMAKNRGLGGSLLSPFRMRRYEWRLGGAGQAASSFLVAYIVVWNIITLPSSESAPPPLRVPAKLLAIEQRWTMFAPYPLLRSGQVFGVATLPDSTEIILSPDGRSPRPLADLSLSGSVVSGRILWREDEQVRRIRLTDITAGAQRWRKFHEILGREMASAPAYAEFLCRDYSAHRGEEDPPAVRVRIVYEYSMVQHGTFASWGPRTTETLGETVCQER